jgi:diguanylate cyclase
MSASAVILFFGFSIAATFALGWFARVVSERLLSDISEPFAQLEGAHIAPNCEFAEETAAQTTSTVSMGPHGAECVGARELRIALKNNKLSLAYQPKFNVRTKSFEAAEALLRSHSNALGNFTIEELVIVAEQSDLIEELTLWTLRRALSDQLELIDHGIAVKTFVNLSAKLLSDSEFTLRAIEILKSAHGRIGLEITETSVIDRPDRALPNLELYKMAGADIAIDDYGVGLSSLRYLKQIPANELKIDREFIMDLTASHRDPMIVRSSIDLAHALGMQVTAEGVDCATKLALLMVMGCDNIQGYQIARPMPLADLVVFMSEADQRISTINSDLSLIPSLSTKSA